MGGQTHRRCDPQMAVFKSLGSRIVTIRYENEIVWSNSLQNFLKSLLLFLYGTYDTIGKEAKVVLLCGNCMSLLIC